MKSLRLHVLINIINKFSESKRLLETQNFILCEKKQSLETIKTILIDQKCVYFKSFANTKISQHSTLTKNSKYNVSTQSR